MVVKFSLKNVKLVKMNETIELDRFYARKKVSIVTCLLNSKPKDYTVNNFQYVIRYTTYLHRGMFEATNKAPISSEKYNPNKIVYYVLLIIIVYRHLHFTVLPRLSPLLLLRSSL